MGSATSCCTSSDSVVMPLRSASSGVTRIPPHTVVHGVGLPQQSSLLQRSGRSVLGTSAPTVLQTTVAQAQPLRRYGSDANANDNNNMSHGNDERSPTGNVGDEDDVAAADVCAAASTTSTTGSQNVNPIFASTVDSLTLLEKHLQLHAPNARSGSTDARTGGSATQAQRETCDDCVSSPVLSSLTSSPSQHGGYMLQFLSFQPM